MKEQRARLIGEDSPAESPQLRAERLARVWAEPRSFWGWFKAVHHTTIGKRYIITAFGFFLAAGLLAGAMRLQLAFPEAHIMGPDLYNQVFTMHGTVMMFLFAVPMMFEALSVYLVPLMVGTRNIAFPRLNAFSYYLFLFGGLALFAFFFVNSGPDRGWFAYVHCRDRILLRASGQTSGRNLSLSRRCRRSPWQLRW